MHEEIHRLEALVSEKEENANALTVELDALRHVAGRTDACLSKLSEHTAKLRARVETKEKEIARVKEQCEQQVRAVKEKHGLDLEHVE